jgi:hypothetical protein
MYKALLILFTIFSSAVACSQTVYLIPRAGVSIAEIKYLDGETGYFPEDPRDPVIFSSRAGFTGGMALEIGILEGNILALQPELLFIQKGFTFKSYNPWLRLFETSRYTFDYLEIPVLVKSTVEVKPFRFFVNAGPSLGRGTGGNQNYLGGRYTLSFKPGAQVHVRDRYDLAVLAGGGIGYRTGRIILSGEARFSWGLRQLNVGEGQGMRTSGIDFKNRFWTITAGIALPLSREKGT